MKIPHGKAMASGEIRQLIRDAVTVLKDRGVAVDDPTKLGSHNGAYKRWLDVVSWLRMVTTKRSASQVACCFLKYTSEQIISGGDR